jgi:hypothetical protein
MKALPFWFVFVGTLFALAGMGFGIWMSITGDHLLGGAHAHNNLLGFVGMMLYGLYYKAVPAAASNRLAVVHFWLALVGALLFGPGIAMAILNQGATLASVGAILSILSMAVFSWIVWSNRSGLTHP